MYTKVLPQSILAQENYLFKLNWPIYILSYGFYNIISRQEGLLYPLLFLLRHHTTHL